VKLLLDTQAFLWFENGDPRLSGTARRRIEDAGQGKTLSVASVWEMAIKIGTGKLRLSRPLAELVQVGAMEKGIPLLAIDVRHAMAVSTLPRHHGDPFDRLLIAQALHEGLAIVSSDDRFDAYGVRRIW
jgi:PIN domain nuclease of toxin-antitoxin system